MKNNCLITSVGRKVSLVRAFKNAGWVVTGQDLDINSIALGYCDYWTFNDFFDTEKYDLVVPTRDGEMLEFRKECPTVGPPLLLPNIKTIETCLDKFKFYKFCKENKFLTPKVYFVKPRISKSGKEVECVWQEMVEGEEYSIDLFADFDSNVINVVPRRRVKVISGESAVTVTVPLKPFLKQTLELTKKLGLVGHNTLQCFLTGSKIVWTDVNLRFGGASALGLAAGCRSPQYLLKIINGEKVAQEIGKYEVGLVGYSYTDWIYE